MKSLISRSLPFLVAVLFCGCYTDQRVDNSKGLAQEMRAMQIKRVTPSQLSNRIREQGDAIGTKASELLASHPDTSGCSQPERLPALVELQETYGVTLRLLYAKDTADAALSPKEVALLQAYLYNSREHPVLSANLQALNDTLTLYQVPLAATHPWVSACAAARASPFVLWNITFNNKEVIRRIDADPLKP